MKNYSVEKLLSILDLEEIRCALSHISGSNISRIDRVEEEAPPDGCTGYVCPKTFFSVGWSSDIGVGCTSVVAKWSNQYASEGHVYKLLSDKGSLVPRAYACRDKQTNNEILLIERLPIAGVDPDDSILVKKYIQSLGKLNAIDPGNVLPKMDCKGKLDYGISVFPDLLKECAEGIHGKELIDESARWPKDFESIIHGMDTCLEALESCPFGMLHLDVAPQNCGQRSADSEILFFDLHGANYGPIVGDISNWSDPTTLNYSVRKTRINIWREFLYKGGGPDISYEQVCDWSDAIKPVMVSGVIGWFKNRLHDGKADFTDDTNEAKAAFRGWVNNHLISMRHSLMSFA